MFSIPNKSTTYATHDLTELVAPDITILTCVWDVFSLNLRPAWDSLWSSHISPSTWQGNNIKQTTATPSTPFVIHHSLSPNNLVLYMLQLLTVLLNKLRRNWFVRMWYITDLAIYMQYFLEILKNRWNFRCSVTIAVMKDGVLQILT